MNRKLVALISTSIALMTLSACSSSKNIKTYWVSGYKTKADAGAGKMDVFKVFKGSDLGKQSWENFYAPINGFNFSEGKMQKIEVKEQKLAKENVPSDASSLKYDLVKVLEEKPDTRAMLEGDWRLKTINGAALESSVPEPSLKIDLERNSLSTNGGCNNFGSKIELLNTDKVKFSALIGTMRACINHNIESAYTQAFNKIDQFKIEIGQLYFYDKDGKFLLGFSKDEKIITKVNSTSRLHDIWALISINGHEIGNITQRPNIELNPKQMTIMGNDGCNSISGKIANLNETNIQFGPLTSTRKMCPDMGIPNNFNQAMRKVNAYKLEKLRLTFYDNKGQELLSFKKAD